MARNSFITIVAVTAALALGGCTLGGPGDGSRGGMDHGGPASPNSQGSDGQNMADVAFAMMMIPHHQQAIDMSDMIIEKDGISAEVVDLARRIKAGQEPEIRLMETWLDDWAVGSPGMDHGGMKSEVDMRALDEATGAAADRLFLTQMIEHHEDAIDMAEREIERGVYAPTVDLARRIIDVQEAEIAEMERLVSLLPVGESR